MAKKTLTGTVVSDKGSKTIVVKIDRRQRHPIYSKSYTVSNKFAAHDEDNSAKVGDRVQIEESPPISKTKAWRLINVLNRAHGDISDEPLKDEVTET